MYSVFNDIDEFMIMIDFLIRSSILYTYGFRRIFMTHEKDLVKKKDQIAVKCKYKLSSQRRRCFMN